jgi:predicted acetyltransferase/RimJ/RimL family protein N-acetyltransferase
MLETKGLVLKLVNQADLDYLIALCADREVMHDIGVPLRTREEVKIWLSHAEAYFQKTGLGIFSVFEKETGEYIGQAALFHSGFDDAQSEIEFSYSLHKKYLNQGYASELAKKLINWGFEEHGLSKIIAKAYADDSDRVRVFEQTGMFYRGMFEFEGDLVRYYDIKNKRIDKNQVQLVPATLDKDYPIIQNMADYYSYDLSEYMGWPQEKDGTFNIGMDFIKYWQADNTFPFIIKYEEELAGFAIVDKDVTDSSNNFNMAQFFIIRKFIGRGIGRQVAFQCFNKFIGKWEVFVMPGNEGAYQFWKKTIGVYTADKFTECTRTVNNYDRNIFEFSTKTWILKRS